MRLRDFFRDSGITRYWLNFMGAASDLEFLKTRYPTLAGAIYNDRFSVQRVSQVNDGRGGWSETWSIGGSGIPGAFVPYATGQKEIVVAGQPKGMADGDVWLPAVFNSAELDVTEKDRLIQAANGLEPERILEIVFPAPHQGILIQAAVRLISEPRVTNAQTEFSFDSPSPLSLGTITANKTLRSVSVHVQTAFDDVAATLAIGISGDADSLMDETAILPLLVESFTVRPGTSFGSDTELFLTITPGASTEGSGYVELEFDA